MDVGDQALIRGLVTASPTVRPEASRSGTRASAIAGHTTTTRESLCRRLAPTPARPYVRGVAGGCARPYAGFTSLPIAQTKPASSRATAVTATVSFLPRAERALYLAQSRDCAFRAMSRTAGGTCRSW